MRISRLAALAALIATHAAYAADTLTAGKTQVRTGSKSDVQAQITDQGGTTLLNVQGNNSAPGAGGGAEVLIGNVQTSAPSYTSGNLGLPWLDTSGRQYVTTDGAATLRNNLVQINGAAPSATNPMPSQLTDGTTAYVSAKTGQLPSALGQSTKAGSVSITIASDQGTLPVSQGAPTGAANAMGTQTNIASAGTTAIACATGLTASTPMKLYRVRVSGAAMARCVIRYNNNGAFTNWVNLMTSPSKPTDEATLPAGFVGLTTGATGTQAIEANCTNFDAAAQDFNCDVSYCIAASGC